MFMNIISHGEIISKNIRMRFTYLKELIGIFIIYLKKEGVKTWLYIEIKLIL